VLFDGQNNGRDDIVSNGDDCSIGSNEEDVRVTDVRGTVINTATRRTRDSVIQSLPSPGLLSQQSRQHLDLLYALAYPKRDKGGAAEEAAKNVSDDGEADVLTADNDGYDVNNESKEEEADDFPIVVPVDAEPTGTVN
jgi:hypothetical protein